MKNILKISLLTLFGALLSVGCSPDNYEMGAVDVAPEDLVEGIAFKIEHDTANPNIVRLISLMDTKYTPLWETPYGRYQTPVVELQIAFEGEYQVTFGVETRGGLVYGAPATFTIDQFYSGFVDHPMWDMLTGGVGEEKTWHLDLDAEGLSRFWLGPKYFFTNTYTWNALHTSDGLTYLDDGWMAKNAISPLLENPADPENSAAVWYWLADWPGNSWVGPAGDYGSMTFDLKGAPHLTVDQTFNNPRQGAGTFMLDVDNMTISFNDVLPIYMGDVSSQTFRILYLTEDALQIAFVEAEPGNLHSFNFISKNYKDNWTPPTEPEPTEPQLPDGWLDDVSQVTVTTTSIKWVLSDQTPFDWAGISGNLLNGFTNPDSYPDWSGFGPASGNTDESFKNFSLTLDSTNGKAVYVNSAGETVEGTYAIDEKGIYTFDNFDIAVTVGSWFNVHTENHQWRILQINKDVAGRVSKMWVGVPNPDKPNDEYMAFCLVPQLGGGGGNEPPQGKPLAFDPAKIIARDIEGNGNLRIEIYNEYGLTAADPPINKNDVVFSNAIEVTFTVSGINLKEGAPTIHDAKMYFADADWDPQGDSALVPVNGDGTYTVVFSGAAEGATVFVVDVVGLWADTEDTSLVTATIDKIQMF